MRRAFLPALVILFIFTVFAGANVKSKGMDMDKKSKAMHDKYGKDMHHKWDDKDKYRDKDKVYCWLCEMGADYTVKETDKGASMMITLDGKDKDDIHEIQKKAHYWVKMHKMMLEKGMSGDMPDWDPFCFPGSKIMLDETDTGVVMTVESEKPGDVKKIRELSQKWAEKHNKMSMKEVKYKMEKMHKMGVREKKSFKEWTYYTVKFLMWLLLFILLVTTNILVIKKIRQ